MKIAFVTEANCIRVLKEAVCLKNMGHEVHLVTPNLKNVAFMGESGSFFYDSLSVYHNNKQFENAIKHLNKHVDIFHYHNEPTWQAYEIRRILPECKIVLDMHDSFLWRTDPVIDMHTGEEKYFIDERMGLECVDGVVFPSEESKKVTNTSKPSISLPPAVPEQWYVNKMRHGKGGIVSQGGHAIPEKLQDWENWRDYTKIYTELLINRNVFAFSPMFKDIKVKAHYMNLGVTAGLLGYNDLLQDLGCYSWNLVGNLVGTKTFNTSMPNKFFDAIAAGVPSVIFNAKPCSDIVKKYDIGITVKNTKELIERWDEHLDKRKNLLLARYELSMERFISRLTELYEKIL